jgi:16S rRNA (guanine527-N7)-methyltransferase
MFGAESALLDTAKLPSMDDEERQISLDRSRALELVPVSRETLSRLDRFVELLLLRNQTTNLIASSTVPQVWTRHVADSLQLMSLAQGRVWADLGSGAGFPGLALACAFAERENSVVHLIESRDRKAAFLLDAARATGAPAVVHRGRVEEIARTLLPVDVVTARALAPLPKLLEYVEPLVTKGAKALLMKGQDVETELTQAAKYWKIGAEIVPSKTSPSGRILVVSELTRSSLGKPQRSRDVR